MAVKADQTVGFGEYLERLMIRSGFANREQLGKASGVEPTTIGRWLRGERPPTIEKLREVAPHLGVDLLDLIVAADILTPAEARRNKMPPPPAPVLPPVVRSILSRLANPRYRQHDLKVLLDFVQKDVDTWDDMIERIEEARAEGRRGRR